MRSPSKTFAGAKLIAVTVLLCTIQFGEAFTVTQLIPYAAFLVKFHLGLDKDSTEPKIGLYVGLLIAIFSAAQFPSSYTWGRFADVKGRRPILLMGLLGTTLAAVGFALAPSLTWCFVARAVAGLLNGNLGVVKTYLAEVVPARQQARAFAGVSMSFSVGLVAGPLLGGVLVADHDLYDGRSPETFLERFPFAIPNLVAAAIAFLAFLTALFLLPETPSFLMLNDPSFQEEQETTEAEEKHVVVTDLGSNQELRISVIQYALCALLFIVVQTCFPLFAQLPRADSPGRHSGLAWDEQRIGLVLGCGGLGLFLSLTFVIPRVIARIGCVRTFSRALIPLALSLLIVPVAFEASSGRLYRPENTTTAAVVCALSFLLLFASGGGCFTSVMMLINNTVPDAQKGTANGIAQAATSFARCVGPLVGAAIYQWTLSREKRWLRDDKWWAFFPLTNRWQFSLLGVLIALTAFLLQRRLPRHCDVPFDERASYRPRTDSSSNLVEIDVDVLDDRRVDKPLLLGHREEPRYGAV
ncbi:MAG: hypothetical protein MHM6MM_001613 [Cercozoa sp. M6MM]